MNYLNAFLITVFAFNSFLAASDEVAIPKPGDDLILTKGESAKAFFDKRALPSTCRTQWASAFKQYGVLKAEFDQLVANHAPTAQMDAKEAEVVKFRKDSLLKVTEECGPCATQDVHTQTVHAPSGAQEWHVTDGSCYFPMETKEKQDAAFETAVSFLSNTELFARQRGGIESILEFVPVDRKTGAFLPQVAKLVPGTNIDTFIAVRGPGRIAFNYIFENQIIRNDNSNGTKEFLILFTGLPRPSGFSPKIYDITRAGTKRNITFKWDISRVKGMWYVRNDGYYRYFTAADFELPLTVGTDFARVTLLDTVLSLAERGK